MRKNRITEIVIVTILIISLASSYRFYISDKKNQNTNISDGNTISSDDSSISGETKDKLVELEKEDFFKTQVVGFNDPLIIYGSEGNSDIKEHTTDNFKVEFSNFRVLEKLPVELLKERLLVFPTAYNEDGSLKKENTCIAKVDFKITNNSNTTAVTMQSGFRCYQVDDQYAVIQTGTNQGNIFFDSKRGKDETTSSSSFIKLHANESYSDTVYFIIDKVTEDNNNLVIKVDPLGESNIIRKKQLIYNNAYGYIRVKYSDIIWE